MKASVVGSEADDEIKTRLYDDDKMNPVAGILGSASCGVNDDFLGLINQLMHMFIQRLCLILILLLLLVAVHMTGSMDIF